MDIVKGSPEYIEYINDYILPDYRIEDFIPSIDEEIIIDMLDSGEYITYDDAYVAMSMKDNGYNLIIE